VWVDDFKSTLSQYFDTPPVLIEALGYWCVSTCLGRRVWIQSPTPMFANTYLIIVSPPGWFRKSSVSKRAIKVVREVLGDDSILPNYASTEAFVESIDQTEIGVLYYDEFRSFMAHSGKEYASGIQPILVEMFDTDVVIKVARRGKEPVMVNTDCIMNFLATTTDAWLGSSLKDSDAMSGFLSRFILVECDYKEKSLVFQPQLNGTVIDDLIRDLKTVVSNVSGEMSFDSGGIKAFEECYYAIEEVIRRVKHPEFPSMIARAPTYTKKLAMAHAAMRGSMEITDEDVYNVANSIVKPSIYSIVKLIEEGAFDDKFQKSVNRVSKVLKSNKGMMSRRDLLRALKIRSSELDELLETMEEQDLINYKMVGKVKEVVLQDQGESMQS
jgi:hypothetical protein